MSARAPLFFVPLALLFAAAAHGTTLNGENVRVGPDEIFAENLYVTGGDVEIRGVCEQDLLVSGGTVRINGEVRGDVLVMAGQVWLGAEVGGDVRAMGGDLVLLGPVAGDLSIMGGNVAVRAPVGGLAMVAGGMLDVAAPIGGDLYLAGGQMTLDADVGGDLVARGNTLELRENARIEGDVDFAGETLDRAEGAFVGGTLTDEPAETGTTGGWFVDWLRSLVGLFVFGLLWFALFRRFAGMAGATLKGNPGQSFALGLATLLGVPLVLGAVFLVGGFVGGWWMSLMGFAVFGIAATLAVPLVALLVGGFLAKQFQVPALAQAWVALLLALAVLTLAMQVPFVGPLFGFVIVAFGLGAIVLALKRTLDHTRVRYDAAEEVHPFVD